MLVSKHNLFGVYPNLSPRQHYTYYYGLTNSYHNKQWYYPRLCKKEHRF